MEILRLNRPKLLAVIRAKMSERYRRRMDEGELDVCGLFYESRTKWYLGIRVKTRGYRHLYIRVKEQRQGIAYTLMVYPDFRDFDWRKWDLMYTDADHGEAYQRLKEKHERRHQRTPEYAAGRSALASAHKARTGSL